MPKSKRAKLVSLTKTDKKGREKKEQLVKDIQEAVSAWKYLWLFEIGRMRNSHLKDIRAEWKGTGRLFFGRVSVMALALGTTPESEFMPGLSKTSKRLQGQIGLFFTSWSPSETLEWFETFSRPEFARMGEISTIDLTLPEGPVTNNEGKPFPHSMEPQLRKLGLATRMVAGVPSLASEHVVCRKGDKLTSEQAQLFKLRGDQTVTFKIALRCMWDKESGEITEGQPALGNSGAGTLEAEGDEEEHDKEME